MTGRGHGNAGTVSCHVKLTLKGQATLVWGKSTLESIPGADGKGDSMNYHRN
jgi:hypothetical protein